MPQKTWLPLILKTMTDGWFFRSLHEKELEKSSQTDDFPIINSEVLLLSYRRTFIFRIPPT